MEAQLSALRQLLIQTREVLTGVTLPEGRAERAHELLDSAIALSEDLLYADNPAAALGAKGGKRTAARGPEYFKKIAGMRKKRSGGRPKKT
jgi:hypothetical protein